MVKSMMSRIRDQIAALEAFKKHGNKQAAADSLGIPRTTLRDRVNAALRGEVGGPPIPPIARPPEGFVINRNSGQYDAEGSLVKQWVGTVRDAGDAYAVPSGHSIKGESALLDSTGHVLNKWVKTGSESPKLTPETLREALKDFDGRSTIVPDGPSYSHDQSLLTVYPIPDLHLGMFAWGFETGEDYDVKIASKLALDNVTRLVSRTPESGEAVLLILGDFFHSNDAKAATPASGNRLDVDGRWQKVFRAGVVLALDLVRIVSSKHKHLEVVVLPGNHDPDSSMSLAVTLGVYYSNNHKITVWDKPSIAWYRRFGRTLLGSTHGHTMKAQAMANMMAADCPREWGESDFCYMYSGHIHQPKLQEVGRVRVESFASPAAKDAYAHTYGFRNSRSLTAITVSSKQGEILRQQINICQKPQ